MKYIILDDDMDTPILFPSYLQHNEVANGRKLVSAGFIRIHHNNGLMVWGGSTSLGLKHRVGDGIAIAEALRREEIP